MLEPHWTPYLIKTDCVPQHCYSFIWIDHTDAENNNI